MAEFLGKKKKEKRKLFCPLVLGKQKAPKAMRWLLGVEKRGGNPVSPSLRGIILGRKENA